MKRCPSQVNILPDDRSCLTSWLGLHPGVVTKSSVRLDQVERAVTTIRVVGRVVIQVPHAVVFTPLVSSHIVHNGLNEKSSRHEYLSVHGFKCKTYRQSQSEFFGRAWLSLLSSRTPPQPWTPDPWSLDRWYIRDKGALGLYAEEANLFTNLSSDVLVLPGAGREIVPSTSKVSFTGPSLACTQNPVKPEKQRVLLLLNY